MADHHQIVHIELSAKDLNKAGDFYNQLFGWTIQQLPELNYATWQPDRGPGGGLNPVTNSNPAGTVLVYVGSLDIDADLRKAEQLGGKVIMQKTEMPDIGWFGIFQDPTGNRIALYTDKDDVKV